MDNPTEQAADNGILASTTAELDIVALEAPTQCGCGQGKQCPSRAVSMLREIDGQGSIVQERAACMRHTLIARRDAAHAGIKANDRRRGG